MLTTGMYTSRRVKNLAFDIVITWMTWSNIHLHFAGSIICIPGHALAVLKTTVISEKSLYRENMVSISVQMYSL